MDDNICPHCSGLGFHTEYDKLGDLVEVLCVCQQDDPDDTIEE